MTATLWKYTFAWIILIVGLLVMLSDNLLPAIVLAIMSILIMLEAS